MPKGMAFIGSAVCTLHYQYLTMSENGTVTALIFSTTERPFAT